MSIPEQFTIFYSWQSDLPNNTNRGFIGKALKKAVEQIHSDEDIQVEARIDSDTQGESGSPNIKEVIFAKIAACDAFLADVSIVVGGETSKGRQRHSPNPNVLIELGFAAAHLGWERIILVFNDAYGDGALLPFDIQQHRHLPYHCEPGEDKKASIRNKLAKQLARAIKGVISARTPPSIMFDNPTLNDDDRRILRTLCELALVRDDLKVGRDALVETTGGEPPDNLVAQLGFLQEHNYLEVHRHMGPSAFSHVTLTERTFEDFLKHSPDHDYAELSTTLITMITVLDSNRMVVNTNLAKDAGLPVRIVDHLLATFEYRGWLKGRRGGVLGGMNSAGHMYTRKNFQITETGKRKFTSFEAPEVDKY